jgi:hypothetical protein
MMKSDLKKAEGLVTRRIAEETFIIPVKGTIADLQSLFVVNPVGEFIWEEIDGVQTIDCIIESVLKRFNVSKEEAITDVREFIGQLRDAGLVEETA